VTSTSLTRRALSLGARDTTTGHCAKTFTETTISGCIQETGSDTIGPSVGYYTRYPHTGYIPDVVHEGDELKDANNEYYLVRSARQLWYADQFQGYVCNLQKQKGHSDRAASSGTWHIDSDSLTTDSRYRTKHFFDTFNETIFLDNGSTVADATFMYAGVDYPFLYEFLPAWNDVDCVVTINKATVTPVVDFFHKIYKYNETVQLQIWAINKTGLTAVNIIDKMYEAIKHVVTDHYLVLGRSIRRIDKVDEATQDLDGYKLYCSTVTIGYTRANNDYVPSLPTVTWGSYLTSGTFTFPNLTAKTERYVCNDLYIDMPSRRGSYPMPNGSRSIEVDLTVDLDVNPDDLTWERPQTSTPKTDMSPMQVFQELWSSSEVSEAYQTLTLEWGSFPVRLVNMERGMGKDSNMLTLTFREYNASAAHADYRHRLGITH
jgi:hypothetical protein